MCLFGSVHPYEQLRQEDEGGAAEHRPRWDVVLFVVLGTGILAYAALEGIAASDGPAAVGACYSSAEPLPGGDTVLRVRHLCPSRGAEPGGWGSYAFVNYTCRGAINGEQWGIAVTPAPGGPSQPGPAKQLAGRQPTPGPEGAGRKLSAERSRLPEDSWRQKDQQRPPPGLQQKRNLQEEAQQWQQQQQQQQQQQPQPQPQAQQQIQPIIQQHLEISKPVSIAVGPNHHAKFCEQVVHNGERELSLFLSQEVVDACSGNLCRKDVDRSTLYSFVGDISRIRYYAQAGGKQPKGLTCCGMRPASPFDDAVAWAAALCGCVSLAWGACAVAPQRRPKAITE